MNIYFVIIFGITLSSKCRSTILTNETKITKDHKSFNNIETSWTDAYNENEGAWSKLLEDYTIRKSNRESKVMQAPHQYIPTSGFYITKRVDNMIELEPHLRPPGKILPSLFSSRQSIGSSQSLREVSETDLYLLGAIEKLVYRVDYIENRLRRSEQLIYYLMAGNRETNVLDPCPRNFTKIGDNCYHISTQKQVNWKAANTLCKSLNSYLAEFESLTENEEMVAFLLNHKEYRGKNFWIGGLNPGLLWIWANSAKPVNPNTNLTSVANSINDNSTDTSENSILNNSNEIKGNGRCLRLSYNNNMHTYNYFGQECTSRHSFLCKFHDKTIENNIKKISRELNLDK